MFFRRNVAKVMGFSERVDRLRSAGFNLENLPDGRVKVSKNGVAAVVGDEGTKQPEIERAGIIVGNEIATLLSGGYQMFLQTPSGKKLPAQAEQLKALHEFEDDVREALGVTNLYNTSMGTVSRDHAYDRVAGYSKPQPGPGRKRRPVIKTRRRTIPSAARTLVKFCGYRSQRSFARRSEFPSGAPSP